MKLTLILALALLIGGAIAAETKVPLVKLNWSQALPENANITLDGGYVLGMSTDRYTAPETFGAVADGSTDDSAALRYALENGTVIQLAPGKTYAIDSPIDPSDWSGKTLLGYGSALKLTSDVTAINISDDNVTLLGTTFYTDKDFTNPVIILAGGATGVLGHNNLVMSDIVIRDENMIADAAASGNWTGIKLIGHGHGANFRNIKIFNPHIGIDAAPASPDWVTDTYWNGLFIRGYDEAIKLNEYGDGNMFSGVSLINTVSTPAVGINVSGGDYNSFSGLQIWWDGDRASTHDAIKCSSTAEQNTFIGGHVEGSITPTYNLVSSMHLIDLHSGASIEPNGIYSNIGTANLVSNGNLETNASGWSAGANAVISADASYHKVGAKSLKVAGNSAAGNAYATQTMSAATTSYNIVTLGAWVMAPAANTDDAAFLYLSDSVATEKISGIVPDDGQWHWVTVSMDISGSSGNVVVSCYATNVGSSDDIAYFDGIQVVDGPVCTSQYSPKIAGT